MALKIGNVFINEDDLSPVIVKASTGNNTCAKGYHVYKNIWKPTVNEELETEMDPNNVMDKYVVCVKKNTSIVEHLPLGKNGKDNICQDNILFPQSRPRCRMQSCHNWQRSKSWQRGRNVSSSQVEDLKPKKNGGNSL